MNTQELQALWEARIKAANSSGQTITAWSKENNISKAQYYYWNRKLNKEDATKKRKAPRFAELSSINLSCETENNPVSAISISWREFSIKVCSKQDIPMAVELMKTLGESC
jgi:hypothetical protein